MTDKLKESNV